MSIVITQVETRVAAKYRFTLTAAAGVHGLWLKVAQDGSVYLGIAQGFHRVAKAVGRMKSGGTQSLGGFQDLAGRFDKYSFHGSGVNKFLGDRSMNPPLRGLTSPRELCWVVFPRPVEAGTTGGGLKKGIHVCIGIPVPTDRPMHARLLAVPEGDTYEVPIYEADNQTTVVMRVPATSEAPRFTLLVCFHDARGAFPPGPLLLVPKDVERPPRSAVE